MPSRPPPKDEKPVEKRDPNDFYDFGPEPAPDPKWNLAVLPEHVKALIAKRRQQKKSG